MSISPSALRNLYRLEQAVRQIQIYKDMDSTRPADANTDELINLRHPQADRIFNWLSAMPSDLTQLVGSEVNPDMNADLYKDYLNWGATKLKGFEEELVDLETKYRSLGLKYHEVPFHLRDPRPRAVIPIELRMTPIIPAAIPINPAILQSLNSIFNHEGPRADNEFFAQWRSLQNTFTGIHTLLNMDYHGWNRWQLRGLLNSVENDLVDAIDLLKEIATQLDGVASNLGEVVAQRTMAEGANLQDSSSIAGRGFRKWVGTFPEVVSGVVNVVIAERVLRTGGAVVSMDWKNEYRIWDEEVEELRTGMSLLWEAERGL